MYPGGETTWETRKHNKLSIPQINRIKTESENRIIRTPSHKKVYDTIWQILGV